MTHVGYQWILDGFHPMSLPDWSEYVGRNCYPGHGAVGLAEGYELQGGPGPAYSLRTWVAQPEQTNDANDDLWIQMVS